MKLMLINVARANWYNKNFKRYLDVSQILETIIIKKT